MYREDPELKVRELTKEIERLKLEAQNKENEKNSTPLKLEEHFAGMTTLSVGLILFSIAIIVGIISHRPTKLVLYCALAGLSLVFIGFKTLVKTPIFKR